MTARTDKLVQPYMIFDSSEKGQEAVDGVEFLYNELNDIAKEYSKDKNESIKNIGINIKNTLNSSDYKLEGGKGVEVKAESLSRGSLYRRRYYGRY